MNVLKRFLTSSETHPAGKVVIGTVDSDYHNIGKYLVNIILEGSGFDVINLGVDVSHAAFISARVEQSVDIIAMSALITTTMLAMRPVIELEKSGYVNELL